MFYLLTLLLSFYIGYRSGRNSRIDELQDRQQTGPIKPEARTVSAPALPAPTVNAPAPVNSVKVELDGTMLLLYFGAFLFVASMGLFVGLSDVSGVIKTIAIALVSMSLYSGGLMLHSAKKRFKHVGIAFVGIGMAIAPLIGVTAFNFVTDSSQGAVVWFLTSLGVFGLYLHALYRLKNTLMSYLFILSFVSLFESAISVIDAPVYYFAWGLAIVGLLIKVAALFVPSWDELKEASYNSTLLLVTLTVATSVMLIPSDGLGQLCVSLGLATVYALSELFSTAQRTSAHYSAAHILGLLTLGATGYYAADSSLGLAGVLIAAAVVHVFVLQSLPDKAAVKPNHALQEAGSIALSSALVATICAFSSGPLLMVAVLVLVALGVSLAGKLKRTDGLVLATVAWSAAPIVFGQEVLQTELTAVEQTLLGLAATLPNYVYVRTRYTSDLSKQKNTAEMLFLYVVGLTIVMSMFGSAWLVIGTATALMLLCSSLEPLTKNGTWAATSGTLSALQLIFVATNDPTSEQIIVSATLALVSNVALSIWFKTTANRWFSVAAWIVYPLAVATTETPVQWTSVTYAWTYVAVMSVLYISRAIALGRLFASNRASVESLRKSASDAYVYGAAFSGFLAFTLSYDTANQRLHTTMITIFVGLLSAAFLKYVENRPEGGALIPFATQLATINAFSLYTLPREAVEQYVVVSSSVALLGYGVLIGLPKTKTFSYYFGRASLAAAFVAPASQIFFGLTLTVAHPLSLILAGLCLLHYAWHTSQSNREAAAAVVVLGVFWLMYFSGVNNVQAYSHILALVLAGYAYWRHLRGDHQTRDSYIYSALAVTTVPLLIQALSSDSGGTYGIWLLLEMVGVMIVGITLKNSIATKWGLYVSVGAVLYQLRDLGWAMLSILAVFIIGLAIYRTTVDDSHLD